MLAVILTALGISLLVASFSVAQDEWLDNASSSSEHRWSSRCRC
jgi:hypothetical protein